MGSQLRCIGQAATPIEEACAIEQSRDRCGRDVVHNGVDEQCEHDARPQLVQHLPVRVRGGIREVVHRAKTSDAEEGHRCRPAAATPVPASATHAVNGRITNTSASPTAAARYVSGVSTPPATGPTEQDQHGDAEQMLDLCREHVQRVVVGVISLRVVQRYRCHTESPSECQQVAHRDRLVCRDGVVEPPRRSASSGSNSSIGRPVQAGPRR